MRSSGRPSPASTEAGSSGPFGLLTAFLTSFYMFRLWFMTFFGRYRGNDPLPVEVSPVSHAHGAHDAHGHADKKNHGHAPAVQAQAHAASSHGHGHGDGHIHESPMVMIIPLAILAILSVVGGWVGWPMAIGGQNHFEHFFEPILSFPAQHVAAAEAERGMEVLLAGVSVAVAILGFGLAWLFYYKRPELPEKVSAWFGELYTTVRDKYYIDELYQTVFVKPLLTGSRDLLWKGIDQNTIDATLNGTAEGAQSVGGALRQMQSGNIRSYASWVAIGAACIVVYMFWLGAK